MDGFRNDVYKAMNPEFKIKSGMVLKTTQNIPLRTGVSTPKTKAGYIKYKVLKSDSVKQKCSKLIGSKVVIKKGKKLPVQEVKTDWKGDVWGRIRIAGAWLPVVVNGK